jgi:hypothetical protein
VPDLSMLFLVGDLHIQPLRMGLRLTCGGTIHWNQSSRKEICDECDEEEEDCRCQREYT